MISKEIEMSGQNVRKYYQRRLPSDPSKDYYYMLRNTANTEALIVEYGFLDSKEDDIEQLKNNWKTYAEAVVKALANYIGVPYTIETSSEYYIVKSGDTLWSIARKYNISVDELKKINNLTSNTIGVGQKLYIKQNNSNNNNNGNTTSDNEYKVQKGDTLYSIARKYNTTVDELKRINNLTSNVLSIGQVLKTPTNYITYKVVAGDTLYGIARKYNTTVTEIVNLNNLATSNLRIGQLLLIPNK